MNLSSKDTLAYGDHIPRKDFKLMLDVHTVLRIPGVYTNRTVGVPNRSLDSYFFRITESAESTCLPDGLKQVQRSVRLIHPRFRDVAQDCISPCGLLIFGPIRV